MKSKAKQIKAKIITTKQARLKYGISSSVLTDWKKKFGEKAVQERKRRISKIVSDTKVHQANIQFWKEFKSVKTEAEIYKTLVDLAKSSYGIDLKKNFGVWL
jgi:hypothetical protein